MATTVLFIEHLLTGIQALIWISLLLMSAFGYNWISIQKVKGDEMLVAFLLLSIVYPIGVLIDNAADQIFNRWNQRIKKKYVDDESKSVGKLLSITKDPFLANYFTYIRTRIRISRSAALNFALITLSSIIFTIIQFSGNFKSKLWVILLTEVVVGLGLTSLAIWGWHQFTHTFAKQTIKFYDILSG